MAAEGSMVGHQAADKVEMVNGAGAHGAAWSQNSNLKGEPR